MKSVFIHLRRVSHTVMVLLLCCIGTVKAAAQEGYSKYCPFVEEGKMWYCMAPDSYKTDTPLRDPLGRRADCVFTMRGDTLINGKEYKKVYFMFEGYYGDTEQHYYCAASEEASRVFRVEADAQEEEFLYDFNSPEETLILTRNGRQFARTGYRVSGAPVELWGFVLHEAQNGEAVMTNGLGTWVEGVGSHVSNPFEKEFVMEKPKLGISILVASCWKGDELLYLYDWMVAPTVVDGLNPGTIIGNHSAQDYFDLQGRRLTQKPQRGVYIQQGRKVIVR